VAGHDVYTLPDDLPVPEDDGACDGIEGRRLADIELPATSGGDLRLRDLGAGGTAVLFIYPRTGKPSEPLPPGWDLIPGARGCTPQSCAFRDLHGEFADRGVRVVGLSAQSTEDQREFAERVRLPFPLLSDPGLKLAEALGLPTFEAAGMTLYKRVTLAIRGGKIVKVFYPVFPPDRNAADVLAWLATESPISASRGSA
jgi:peroxiredoxin